jgi:glycine hydroxymethyltransferase
MTQHTPYAFFSKGIDSVDPEIMSVITQETVRQQSQIELIASENIVSKAVLEAVGTVLTNKYAEGYPGKRYYGGCEAVDVAEELAIKRAKELFSCEYVNVQPHAGAQANEAVYLALIKPGDTILGMSLDSGGHLTHGAAPNISGKWFNAIQYGVTKDSALIDYDQVQALAFRHKPKLIIAGGSAYPRIIDFKKFREIADSVQAYLMVDMAHFSGLVAGGIYPNPLEFADVVTTTTHKTLRGPRGGMILSNKISLGKRLNSAIFPGLQGGPLMHVIAGKAVAFGEALKPQFTEYVKQVVSNAKVLATTLASGGVDIVSGGTDSHLILVDLRPKGLKGNKAEAALEAAGMTCNKNGIPFDEEKPMVTSGIRLGTPAATTRGFGEEQFEFVGKKILEVLDSMTNSEEQQNHIIQRTREEVESMCRDFPIYS